MDLRGPLGDLGAVLARPSTAPDGPLDDVRAIIADVRERGDAALRDLTVRYDGVDLENVVVDPEARGVRSFVPTRTGCASVRSTGRSSVPVATHPVVGPPTHPPS